MVSASPDFNKILINLCDKVPPTLCNFKLNEKRNFNLQFPEIRFHNLTTRKSAVSKLESVQLIDNCTVPSTRMDRVVTLVRSVYSA